MSDDSYDVYVHEGHIVEVHRGEHGTVARIYGEDWNTPPMVQFHAAAMEPVTAQQPRAQWCEKYGGLYDGNHCEMCTCERKPAGLKITADPNREARTNMAFNLAFGVLLLLCLWIVLG